MRLLMEVKRFGHCLGFYLTADEILFRFGGRQLVSKIAAHFEGEKDSVFAPSAGAFSYQERINDHKMFACLRTSSVKCHLVSGIGSWNERGWQWRNG